MLARRRDAGRSRTQAIGRDYYCVGESRRFGRVAGPLSPHCESARGGVAGMRAGLFKFKLAETTTIQLAKLDRRVPGPGQQILATIGQSPCRYYSPALGQSPPGRAAIR